MLHYLSNIRTRTAVLLTIGVAVLMLTSAYVELRQSREELFHVLEEHSRSLAGTIVNSSANIVLSTDQIETQIGERLLNNARMIALVDSLGKLDAPMLNSIAMKNGIFRVIIFDKRGRRIISNHPPDRQRGMMQPNNTPGAMVERIISGREDEIIIGLKEPRFGTGHRFAVAVKRTNKAGGAIIVNLDAAKLVEFRKQIGIGKLVNDLGGDTGIDFVVIQDAEGILAATKNVKEMSNLANDAPLRLVMQNDTAITREVSFNGMNSFEVVKRLTIDGATVGVLRIGLSMDELRAIDERMQRRLLVISAVMAVFAVLVILLLLSSRTVRLISGKYSSIRSLTGDILEHMNDAVLSLDDEGKFALVNRQAELLFGVSSKEIVGQVPGSLSEQFRAAAVPLFALADGDHERTIRLPGKQDRIISVSISTTSDNSGRIEARTMVIKDLTETRRMEQQMQRNEKMSAMGELAAGVAHEIRNPLNAISMIAQRFEKEFVPKKDVREYTVLTGVLKRESVRINGIIRQFLRFARPKAITPERMNAVQFIENLSAIFRSQSKQNNVVFTATSEDVSLLIDGEQMTQACLNLLQNALDATPSGGAISLGLHRIDDRLEISIADTGEGIPDGKREKIFDLYYTTKSNGTGMGLAITQQIVAQHSGSIRLDTNNPSGSVFTITLPSETVLDEKSS